MATYTGSWSGQGNAAIRVVLEIWTTNQDETGATVHWNRYLQATGWVDGNFSTSWAGTVTVYQTSGTNNYAVVGGTERLSYGQSDTWSATTAEIWTYGGAHWYSSIGSVSYKPDVPTWTPNALTSGSVTRVSDSTATINATRNPTTTRPYTAIEIERRIDSGAWNRIATVTFLPYRDGSNAADHTYSYRVRAKNSAGYSSYLTCGTITNTPAAPRSVSVARSGQTSVVGTVSNSSVVATSIEIQRSVDKSAVAATLTSNAITSFTDNPGGGTFYYRARNKNAVGTSDWTAWSNGVVTIRKPNAPTLVSPANSVAVSTTNASVSLSWQHNPLDGSAQTAWRLQYSTNGGSSWSTVSGSNANSSYTFTLSSVSAGTTVMWRVSTKGAHDDYSDYSSARSFLVATPPTISIEEPTGIIDRLPMTVRATYSDMSGYSLQRAVMTFAKNNGTVAYTKVLGSTTHGTISSGGWVPEDGVTYVVTLQATSTSTLSSTVRGSFNVSYIPPYPASIIVSLDESTGYVNILASVEKDEEGTFDNTRPTISVWRVVDNIETLIVEGAKDGDTFTDRYAPLNKDFHYKVVTFASSGAANVKTYKQRISSEYAYMMWGDGKTAMIRNSVHETFNVSRPDKVRVYHAGATDPRSYDTDSLSETVSMTGQLIGYDSDVAWREFVESGGRGVYKSLLGRVVRVDADVNIAVGNYKRADIFDLSAEMVRIKDGI